MNKKYIYWGLGLIAVGGLAYYFMSGNQGGAKSLGDGGSASADTPLTDGANSTPSSEVTSAVESIFTSAGTKKKQIRVNCRVEAKARFPRGRQRSQWRKECKRNGGYDDGLDM